MWIDHMNRFIGGDDGLFIDESFADFRGPGEATQLHSGAHKRRIRTQYRFHNNLERLTPERRKIVQPLTPNLPPGL